jgi:hypothetical protein
MPYNFLNITIPPLASDFDAFSLSRAPAHSLVLGSSLALVGEPLPTVAWAHSDQRHQARSLSDPISH